MQIPARQAVGHGGRLLAGPGDPERQLPGRESNGTGPGRPTASGDLEGLLRVGTATWRPERADVAEHLCDGVWPARATWRDGSFLGPAVTRRGRS